MSTLRMRTSLLAAVLALAASGCSTDADRRDANAPPQAGQASPLRSALGRVSGAYEWNSEVMAYVFSSRSGIAELIGAGTDETIDELVNCLDDTNPSLATLKSQPVPIGMLCYEALRQLVYYEPTAADGDIALTWPGHIEPTATAAELREARRAWRRVVDAKAFIRQ